LAPPTIAARKEIAMKRIVVITGAGSGLGASLARKYSEVGDIVVLLGRTKEKLLKVSQTLTHENYIYPVDISVKHQVRDVFHSIYAEIGDVDILINNAGVGYFDFAENIEEEFINEMIDINLKGTIFCTQEVINSMKQKNQGYIINIISKSGKRPVVTESVYCASKFGISGFTESLALELENTSVRVIGFYMGNMATDLWKDAAPENLEKFIDPDDMAELVLENTKIRKHLAVEEVIVKNLRN
jgi:short-subunit dehydrogenase